MAWKKMSVRKSYDLIRKSIFIQQPSLGGTLFLILNFLVSNNFSVQTFYVFNY